MRPLLRTWCFLVPLVALPTLPAQGEWTGEKLAAEAKGFLAENFTTGVEQIGALVEHRAECYSAVAAAIHGDHREYLLKVERLLRELTDERWEVREKAERSLIEIGGRAKSLIQEHRDSYEFIEQHIRCTRILEALTAKGEKEQVREERLLRGLVQTALYLDPDVRLRRALRSALGHTDSAVVRNTIRALGKLGGDEEVLPVEQMLDYKGGIHREVAAGALGRMRSDQALASCRELLAGGKLNESERFVVLRALHSRDDAGARGLLQELESSQDPLVAAGARLRVERTAETTPANFRIPDAEAGLDARFGGFLGESLIVHNGFAGLDDAELAFADADVIEFPHEAAPLEGARVFLTHGSLVIGRLRAVDADVVALESPLFGQLALARKDIQGIAIDPGLDRLVGAAVDHDRIRLRTDAFLEGHIRGATAEHVRLESLDGRESEVPFGDIAGILFARPRQLDPDPTVYTRLELVTGERLIAFVAAASGTQVGVVEPKLGTAVLPLTQVRRMELGVGGGALWGFTLIADYSDNRVIEVDDQGRIVFQIEDMFGAWDAECLDNGHLLVTEFSVSRVQEIDREGHAVWYFEDLKNPYDADLLPNGNVLIADTFGSRVIEVRPDRAKGSGGEIVWQYAQDIRPFDCERLANGNTLIADIIGNRVIEVNVAGEIVWEIKDLPNAHDVDRLPNGNTLVTLRSMNVVRELDREGNVVWELTGLSSPSDADRLPNGHTLVAQDEGVKEFDRRGNVVWKKETAWAVEVNRY